MQTIRRIKGDGTHYAKSVDETGTVTVWTFGEAAEKGASAFDDDVAAKVKANYLHRPEAGRLEFVDENGRVVFEQGMADEPSLVTPATTLDVLAGQVRDQQVELESLRDRVESLEAE